MELNLIPFVIETLGMSRKIYKDIDKIYQENKYEFYKFAKENELYNHTMLKEGSLIQEEYNKKLLGIFLYLIEHKDEYLKNEVFNLIKKSYRYSYIFVENNTVIDLNKFTKSFLKKYKGVIDENANSIENHVIIVIFLALNSGKEIIKDDYLNGFIDLLNQRWEHYNKDNQYRIDISKVNDEDKEKIKLVKSAIYKKYGAIKTFDDVFTNGIFEENKLDVASFLFDYENLSSVSIFQNIKFTDKDIDEILYLYILKNKQPIDNEIVDDATKFLISHMYIKYLIKSYKQVKEMYFENNKETIFIELEELEKSLNNTTKKLFLEKRKSSELQNQNELLEKEIIRLKKELDEEKKNKAELIGLREFVFSLDKQEEFVEEEINLENLKQYKSVVIGGHEKWQQKMKELLPNFIFIHPDNLNFDVRILNGVEIIFIYVNYLNHAIYYKVMNAIEGKNIKVIYLNQQNENKVLQVINKIIGGMYNDKI